MDNEFTHWEHNVEVSLGVSDEAGSSRRLTIAQDPMSHVLGSTVWDSSKTLLKFIEQHPDHFMQFTKICELGAGCGALCGMACAIGNRGMSDIVLTDIAAVLPWLRRNVLSNLLPHERDRVRIEEYQWGTSPQLLQGPFDCILCADVVYERTCVRPLMQSLLALSHRKTTIFMANERRAPDVHDAFIEDMSAHFKWKQLERRELDEHFIKDSIEVFVLQPKRRKIPNDMQIPVMTAVP